MVMEKGQLGTSKNSFLHRNEKAGNFRIKFFSILEIKDNNIRKKNQETWWYLLRTMSSVLFLCALFCSPFSYPAHYNFDEAATPIRWPPDAKSWLFEKDPDAGKECRQKEKGLAEDEMCR